MSVSGKNSAGILFSSPSSFFKHILCKPFTIYSREQGARPTCEAAVRFGPCLPPAAHRRLYLRDRGAARPRNPGSFGPRHRWAAVSSFCIVSLPTYTPGAAPIADLTHWGCLRNLREHLGSIVWAYSTMCNTPPTHPPPCPSKIYARARMLTFPRPSSHPWPAR